MRSLRVERSAVRLAVVSLGLLFGRPDLAFAQAGPVAGERADERTELARRHFKNGVKLFQDQNYQGALAEFEAAYELKAGAASIQNVALCLKALFRYAEAAEKLEQLLSRHASELSDPERKSLRDAIAELSQLVGSIVVRVTPADAKLTVDQRSVEPPERAAGIRLDVGEHTLVAEAPGYEKLVQVVRISGGKTRLPVDLTLKPIAGFIAVTVDDPDAAIAVDGQARSFHRWTGPVTPGRHYVQVYKQGHKTFERAVSVELGRTVHVGAVVGPALAPGEIDLKVEDKGQEPENTEQRGWYALGAISIMGLDEAPEDLNVSKARQTAGSGFGVRAGYRIWTPVGVELLLEGGRHEVEGACDEGATRSLDPQRNCNDAGRVTRTYRLDSFRIGGNLRIMSSGERVRFNSILGVGVVRHTLTLDEADQELPTKLEGGEAKGNDPYFLVELGAQFNFGHILLEGDVILFVDGASGIRGDLDSRGDTAVFGSDSGGLRMLGLGLRGGWGEWKPR